MAETRNRRTMLRMSFDAAETELLLVWAQQASHMSWTDKATLEAARELSNRLRWAVQAQCPQVDIDGTFGDFT